MALKVFKDSKEHRASKVYKECKAFKVYKVSD